MNRIKLGEFKGWNLSTDDSFHYIQKEEIKCAINHNQVVYGDLSEVYSELKNRLKILIKSLKEKKDFSAQ